MSNVQLYMSQAIVYERFQLFSEENLLFRVDPFRYEFPTRHSDECSANHEE